MNRKLTHILVASTALAAVLGNPAYGQVARSDGDSNLEAPRFDVYSSMGTVSGDNLGNHTAIGELNMNGFAIFNQADPSDPMDGVNLRYLQDYVTANGDNMGNHTATRVLNMSGFSITQLPAPTGPTEAANRAYVDTAVAAAGDDLGDHTATEDLNLSNNRIINLGDPVNGRDGVHLNYMRNYVAANGDDLGNHTATQDLMMQGFRIQGLQAPVDDADGVNKLYVDTAVGGLGGRVDDLEAIQIIAGTGLTGGGDLTQNRTLAFDTVWGDGRYALRGRSITAGTGLTGGGDLSANRSLAIDLTYGDNRWINRTGNVTIAGTKTFSGAVIVNTPTANTHAANKGYVDAAASSAVDTLAAGDGLTLSGRVFSVDATVVRTSGDQDIAGIKRFYGLRYFSDSNVSNGMVRLGRNANQYIDVHGSTGGNFLTSVSPQVENLPLNLRVQNGALTHDFTFRADGRVSNVATPSAATDAANRAYVDAAAAAAIGTTYTAGTGLSLAGTQFSFSTSWGDARYALRGRVLTAGDGISGGGDLSANRTFSVDSSVVRTARSLVAGDGLSGGGNLSANRTFAVDATVVRTARNLVAGDGLSGGGNLGANRSFAVDATVVRTSGDQSIAGVKSFSAMRFYRDSNVSDGTLRFGRNAAQYVDLHGSTGGNFVTSVSPQADNLPLNLRVQNGALTHNFAFRSDGRISNVAAPIVATDAANRAYVDAAAAAAVGTTYTAGTGLSLAGTQFSFNTTWGDGRYALRARVLTAGDGIIGGGDLSANRTFAVDSTVVRTARNLVAGDGLTGGGNLGADRAFAVDATVVRTARTLVAGDGLTGGGNLGANRAFAVDGSVVRTSGDQSIAGVKTFSAMRFYRDSNTANGTLRFGRNAAQYVDLHGSTGGNFVTSVSPEADNLPLNLRVQNGALTHNFTFRADGRVSNVASPVAASDAANRAYVDAAAASAVGTTYTAGTGLALAGTQFSFNATWGDGRYALRGRALTAGTGLTGGGDLSANRTLSFNTTWGDARYALRGRSLTAGDGITGGGDLSANRTFAVDGTVVRTSRNLVAGDGLTGGGNLGANRTLAVDSSVVRTSRSINAGTGLTGGGNLGANRSLSVDSTVFRTAAAIAGNLRFASGDGRGMRFWDSDAYKIYMSSSGNSTWGGRLDGTSDYNMYFRMTGGSNRGFVFQNGTTSLFQVAGNGSIYGSNGRVIRDADGGWIRTYGDTGWFNATHSGGWYMQDSSWVRSYNNRGILTGGVMRADNGFQVDGLTVITGNAELNANSRVIQNVATPTANAHAANKAYVDSVVAGAYSAGTGISMSGGVISFNTSYGDGRYAMRARSVATGTGLTGGGDLSANRTLSFNTTWGDARYALRSRAIATGAGLSGGGNLSANRTLTFDTVWGDARYAQAARAISAGTGLTGGGNLTANRSLAFDTAWGDGRYVQTGRRINTGAGITGGGTLTANRTLSLTANQLRRNAVATDTGVLAYNGHTRVNAQFYGGDTNPNQTTRLNYNGSLYATRFYSQAYFYFSDRTLKEDIETIDADSGMTIVRDLRPVSYAWRENGQHALGVIAQEVEEVLPMAVSTNEAGIKAVDYIQMIAPMLAAIQDLDERVQALEAATP